MVTRRFLQGELARTRPSKPEIAAALSALDKSAAQRFASGDYGKHFRDNKNIWSHEARAQSWALAYIAYGPILEDAASLSQEFSRHTGFSSPWADREVIETLDIAAHQAGATCIAVAIGMSPAYQAYLEQLSVREAPVDGQLARTTDEVNAVSAYQNAALLRTKGPLIYSPSSRVVTAWGLESFINDTLTFILYADGHEVVDAVAYQAGVARLFGGEGHSEVLVAVEAGFTVEELADMADAGVSVEYALAMKGTV